MSFGVGIPFLKCSFNPSKRQEGKKAPKTGYAESIWKEYFDERYGLDPDIDKSHTHDNLWLVEPGTRSAEEYIKQMKDYLKKMSADRQEQGLRAYRSDCVCTVNGIIKVPIEIANNPKFNSDEFFKDALDVLREVVNDDRRCGIIDACVVHRDEFIDSGKSIKSDHMHFNILPFVYQDVINKESGEILNTIPSLNAKEFFNSYFLDKVNVVFRKRMQEKGWAVEDCKMYDCQEEEQDPEKPKKDKKKQQKKQERGGKDSATYKAAAEARKQELIKENEKLKRNVKELNEELDKLTKIKTEKEYLAADQDVEETCADLDYGITDVEEQIEIAKEDNMDLSPEYVSTYASLFRKLLNSIKSLILDMEFFEIMTKRIDRLSVNHHARLTNLNDRINNIQRENDQLKKELDLGYLDHKTTVGSYGKNHIKTDEIR